MLVSFMLWRIFAVDANANSSAIIYISVIAAGIGTVATALGVWYTAKAKKKEIELAARQADIQEHSVTFDEMEAAIPGLGELVRMWQGQAQTAWLENRSLREEQLADHGRILELESQVSALKAEVIQLRSQVSERDTRIKDLEKKAS